MRYIILPFLFIPLVIFAQQTPNLDNVQPGRFDQGKMWTFENPPVEYFQEVYGFTPTQEWMDDIRKSALRFATWCSASFISSSGLIMTNHHCSRSVVSSVMSEEENFDENGFYATTLEEERRVPDLFVDQMVMIADITEEVAKSKLEVDSALSVIKKRYSEKEDWVGLELETRTFYSGGKFSLYGFKRYGDVRLVLYPELPLGYFGGDPDNFTYPRYNLDFTFFRAYDDEGHPLQPENYFEFNPKGAEENEPVFVIGNPGSTGRYLTMAQLYYQRDVSVPAIISLVKNRKDILLRASEMMEDVYAKDSIVNLAFSLSNSEKAYEGRLDGLNDPYLMTKKRRKEESLRKNATTENDPWIQIEENAKEATKYYAEAVFLGPDELRGKINQIIHQLGAYKSALDSENEEAINKSKEALSNLLKGIDINFEKALFTALLIELEEHSRQDYVTNLLNGMEPASKAANVMEKSILLNQQDKFFKLKASKIDKEPLVAFAEVFPKKLQEAGEVLSRINAENAELQSKVMNVSFQVSGLSSPPDATFSLRMADGVVKGYDYNGTTAPYKTTYFGLYDRYYSNDQESPWNLPEKWDNPPLELLKAPLNFVSTTDIIGGNSGSPVINQNAEVVGLAFDGNIESLPGYFIFDDEYNRTVSVHAGGIAAAIKYIYKAKRLLSELNSE
ncbi:MAG: S46 family peptidase [Cyclobacteriaceae bacterium]|nr:S46 family peptidase [Cyclobacteriaceae bacterium HetDA_MAG_MS6]